MFFFEQTFQTVLNGIDGAGGPMGAITNIANAILLLCALFAVYEAYARGGDARMIGVAAAKFLILGLIVSNYSTIFRNVNGAFNQVAATISPNDWADNWMLQVNQYFNGLGNANWFNRKRLTNPGEDQAWDADQRAGVSWATSASLRRFMPGSTSMR